MRRDLWDAAMRLCRYAGQSLDAVRRWPMSRFWLAYLALGRVLKTENAKPVPNTNAGDGRG
jgi:hypothetical protein